MTAFSLSVAPFLDDSFPLPLDRPFHAHDARRVGVPRGWLTTLCRTGQLRRLMKGVYVARGVPDSTQLRIAALRLVVPSDAVICDRHAGWLHGAEMILAPNEDLAPMPVRLMRYPGSPALRNGWCDSGQRALLAEDVEEIDGLLVTTRLRTMWDLGRSRSRVHAISGMDAMLRTGGLDRDAFLAGIERFTGERWVRHLRELAPLTDVRSESPGESASKLVWWDVTGSMPELQLAYGDGTRSYRLDLGSREWRFALEYDGEEWHSTPEQRARDATRRQWITEEFDVEIRPVRAENVYGATADLEAIIRSGLARGRRRAPRTP